MTYYTIQKKHACAHLPMGFYRPPEVYSHQNYNVREEGVSIDTLVLHYTVSDYAVSYKVLAHADGGRPGPSVHYMINVDGRIDNLVDDSHVAWHAGVSMWHDKKYVNKNSIGIELINPGSGEQGCYPVGYEKPKPANACVKNAFSPEQLKSLYALIHCLKEQHTAITHDNIIGHSDISPGRKIDPGVMFPWKELHKQGFGIYSDKTVEKPSLLHRFRDSNDSVQLLKTKLKAFGYGFLDNTTQIFDEPTAHVVRAFHLHYNQGVEQQGHGWGDWNSVDEARLQDLMMPEPVVPSHIDL